ncbi:MAG: ATP synthase F0 subunit B [Solirubrobacterales bacterium]
MDRDQIIRDDFPLSRRGWDRTAVRSHLKAIADGLADAAEPSQPSLGSLAATQVGGVLDAAEAAAEEIRSSAQAEADGVLSQAHQESDQRLADAHTESERLLADARSESERLLEDARNESVQLVADAQADLDGARAKAADHVEQAQSAVDALIAQAEDLRPQLAAFGESITQALPPSPSPVDEVPGPVTVPEPMPPTIPEPTPDPVPTPTPDSPPEPIPDPPSPDLPDEPGPLEPPEPEPSIDPPAAGGTSTEDLIAQLRSAPAAEETTNGSTADAEGTDADLGAARLVAMNMALDNVPREEIKLQLRSDFGDIDDLDGLLDEIEARVGS